MDPLETDFDAIVIGSGISGGWAAKEFCDKGFKTLVLERGRQIKHVEDYPTAHTHPWEMEYHGRITQQEKQANPIVSRCYAYGRATEHFFVKDNEHPYQQDRPFDWIRAYQVGGKSLLWARQVQRWSRFEFERPHRDGYGIKWPINYEDLAPWYSHVERFIGVSGNNDGLEEVPDGEFLPAWEMNAIELYIQDKIKKNFSDRTAVIGRCAHLTDTKEVHLKQGRNRCMARTRCERGCPLGAYFSSNSSTLPWANKTGNLTLKTHQVVSKILYDSESQKATGVEVIDAYTKTVKRYTARVIFVNAATINTNVILLNSTSERFPNGLGNDNGLLGRYLSFHNYRGQLTAKHHGAPDSYYRGRRPTSIMIPSFRNKNTNDADFQGGYMMFYSATREGWSQQQEGPQFGTEFIRKSARPGPWSIYMMMQGETIPIKSNRVYLTEQLDQFGIPKPALDVGYTDNDEKMLNDFLEQGVAMLQKAGCVEINAYETHQAPGLDIHEMGGVRMGDDPNESMLNSYNQLHHCSNVFVTDGACMSSTGVQNPSLTFMALTARAVAYAADQLKEGML
ncbi:MAG: GMC oxidoreductase [Flavobacteriaceae bacterium]